MAAGDDILLENGHADRGLGRIFYFSAPRVQYNRTLGNSENDNTAKMLASRDPVQWYLEQHFIETKNSYDKILLTNWRDIVEY